MAAAAVPHVTGFGSGVVLEGSADTQRTDELLECDGYDIGPRGALIAARDVAGYVTVNDLAASPGPWNKILGLRSVAATNFVKELAVGQGLEAAAARYLLASFAREGEGSPVTGATAIKALAGTTPTSEGVLVTFAEFPGVYPVTNPVANISVFLVNLGAREGYAANLAPGLYVAYAVAGATEVFIVPISTFDALGTGSRGEVSGGTQAQQLYFRGIAGWNAHAFGWGFDQAGGTDREGPARLMFCNLNKPLKWGNDNFAASGDRDFTDSDAIPIGDGGEIIRGAVGWNKRLWIGTDKQFHFLAGYGRDSFITDGASPVAKAENLLGPNALIEGPDKLLYGVGDRGLWAFDESTFERHHSRLRDFSDRSVGWWDLIWTNRQRSDTYPGKTNADLVWLVTDWDSEQVVVGIPWCNASTGRGYGTDTVLIKFSVRTGGFSRQVFSGVQYTAADYMRRQRQFASSRLLGTATSGQTTIKRYGAADAVVGRIANPFPAARTGEYSLYGPNGIGVYRKLFLTLAWEDADGNSPIGDWGTQATPVNTPLRGIAWSPELGRAVAVGDTLEVLTSTDLVTWTSVAMPAGGLDWYAVAWCPEMNGGAGRFVATGLQASPVTAAYSDDGLTWVLGTSCGVNNAWVEIAYSPSLVRAVAGGSGGASPEVVMSTDDGITWTDRTGTMPAGYHFLHGIVWSEERSEFLTIAYRNADTMYAALRSADGITWTHVADIVTAAGHFFSIGGLKWSASLSKYVAIDTTAALAYVSSDGGLTWTSFALPAAISYSGLAWIEELELFVVVAQTGTGNRIAVSDDGETWETVTSPSDEPWVRVAYAPALNTLFACASGNNANLIMTANAIAATPGFRFLVTPIVDGQELAPVRLWIQIAEPTSPMPEVGDVWVDLSCSDTDLGNATAGALVPANADYIVRRRLPDGTLGYGLGYGMSYGAASEWRNAFFGGQRGNRVTVPIAFDNQRGTRVSVRIEAEESDRRWQLEGLGFRPSPIGAEP